MRVLAEEMSYLVVPDTLNFKALTLKNGYLNNVTIKGVSEHVRIPIAYKTRTPLC